MKYTPKVGQTGKTFGAHFILCRNCVVDRCYCIFGFIFGWICIMVEKNLRVNPCCRNELLWMFMFVGVIFSSMGWRYTQVSVVVTLFCIWFSGRTRKTICNGNNGRVEKSKSSMDV